MLRILTFAIVVTPIVYNQLTCIVVYRIFLNDYFANLRQIPANFTKYSS